MLTDEYLKLVNDFHKIASEMVDEIYEQNKNDIMNDRVVNFVLDRYDIYNKYSEKIHKILQAIKLDD